MAIPQTLNTSTRSRHQMTVDTSMRQQLDVPAAPSQAEVLQNIIIHGDLSRLTPAQEVEYIKRLCEAIGISYLTRPFAFLNLNGKRVCYALRDCTDQLRLKHKISVVESSQEELGGVYIVVVKLQNAEGRTDIARGAIHIAGLKGLDLANAIMKAETKAKRRGTLSISGLGLLDETEVEGIAAEKAAEPLGWKNGRKTSAEGKRDGSVKVFNEIRAQISKAPDLDFLKQIPDCFREELTAFPFAWSATLSEDYDLKWQDLGGDPDDNPMREMREPGE